MFSISMLEDSRIKTGIVVLLALAVLAGCSDASSRGDKAKNAAAGQSDVVVRMGDESITLAEVDAKSKAIGMKAYQDLYDQRRLAIDQMVAEKLIDAEAESRGVTPDELLQAEITDKLPEISDSEVQAFYQQNSQAMGGRELDDNLSMQIKQYLSQQNLGRIRQEFLDGLRSKSDVKITLAAPRVDLEVAADEPADGPASAPVTIVEYSDFQCPYCARVTSTLDQIKEAYGDKVRIVFRDYPLPSHPQAVPAAEAAKCANEQGKFWEYHDKLFASQRELGPEKYKEFAKELGLDMDEFDACVDSDKYVTQVRMMAQGGQQLGVSGTPAFFVNGRFLSGAKPFESFKSIIDEELAN
jgi:protein-disulfide isomerase